MATNPNWPLTSCQVAFNSGFATGGSPSWTDLTPRMWSLACDRGRQYELDQTQAGQGGIVLSDKDEYLNTANTSSPYYPTVLPYRQICVQAMWPPAPVGSAVNTLNATAGFDGSFESYATGIVPPGLLVFGALSPVVTTTGPFQGTKCLTWNVTNGAGLQGLCIPFNCIPGQTYTASVYINQSAANTHELRINGHAAMATTSTAGSYVRLVGTFTADQPSLQLCVDTASPTLNSTVTADAIQIEPGSSVNAFSATGPVIYGVHRGYVERWPVNWNHQGMYGYCQITTVDAFAALAARKLHSEYVGAVLAKNPTYYWKLDEPQGASRFAESSGNNGPPLVLTNGKYGPADSFAAGTAMAIAGDPGATGFQTQTTNAITSSNIGITVVQTGLNGTQPITLASSTAPWAYTVAFWMSHTTSTSAVDIGRQALHIESFTPGVGAWAGLQIFPTQTKLDAFVNTDSLSFTDNWGDGKPHLYVIASSFSLAAATENVYVDGALVATDTFVPVAQAGPAPCMLTFGGVIQPDIGTTGAAPQNFVGSHLAIWNRMLSAGEVTDLWNAGKGYVGETSGTRIARYLSFGNYTGATSVDTGQSLMGVDVITEGTNLLDACQAVTLTENGNFWANSAGTLTFTSRTRRYLNTTVKWVFGENQAGGQNPYENDIAFDFDATLVYNDVTVTNSGGAAPEVEDNTSQTNYGPRSYQRQVNLQNDNEATDAANWVLSTHKDPHQRIATLTIKPSANPALWPVALGAEIGDRVTVIRSTTAFTMSSDYFIENISHSQKPDEWTVQFQMSPASLWPIPWILGDSTYGVLDTTTKLAY